MAIKFVARLVYEKIYEVDPSHYGTDQLEEMLEIDRQTLSDDPMSILGEDDIVECSVEQVDES